MNQKRNIDIAVISDVHLGTYGCHARELIHYLNTINPRVIILNGDFIDGWQFSKDYFPDAHILVIRQLLNMMSEGTRIFYLTGNHDEMLRRFSGMRLGKLLIEDKLLLNLNGKKHWFFHGDVFDVTMTHSKWLAKLGSKGYDLLILTNRFINFLLEKTGREKISLSKRIKNSVKRAVKFLNDFEQTAAELAIHNHYDYVICGHVHNPSIREVELRDRKVIYMNSGDWVENLSALEYSDEKWNLIFYKELDAEEKNYEEQLSHEIPDSKKLFERIVNKMVLRFGL